MLLGPMAGVTDTPFRRICRRFGAALVYTEFLSSDGLVLRQANQAHKLLLADDEHPVAYQLFGANTELFARAAAVIMENGPDLIDLNFGCPVKKVVKGNAGAAVLRDLNRLEAIVRAVVESVPVPVTIKMRAGWDADSLVYQEAAERAISAGAMAVTLHARTRADGNWGPTYHRGACWEWIADLKRNVTTVPVIGNGDVDSPESAARMLDETGCDAVMVARAAIGAPWIFAQINKYLETGEHLPEPSIHDRLGVALHNLREKIAESGHERGAVFHMRRQMAAYIKGLPGGGRLRSALMTAESFQSVRALFADYMNRRRDDWTDDDDWLSEYLPFDRGWMPVRRVGAAAR